MDTKSTSHKRVIESRRIYNYIKRHNFLVKIIFVKMLRHKYLIAHLIRYWKDSAADGGEECT